MLKGLTFRHKMPRSIWVEAVNSLQPQLPQQHWGPYYVPVIHCKIHPQLHIEWSIWRPAENSLGVKTTLKLLLHKLSWLVCACCLILWAESPSLMWFCLHKVTHKSEHAFIKLPNSSSFPWKADTILIICDVFGTPFSCHVWYNISVKVVQHIQLLLYVACLMCSLPQSTKLITIMLNIKTFQLSAP
jgi:hypothetical protein